MKLVIDIPEDVYKRTVFYREFKDLNDCVTTIEALENGTPFPKGHGRIIDENKITTILFSEEKRWIDEKTGYRHFSPSIIRGTDAPTIIEADKDGEQE